MTKRRRLVSFLSVAVLSIGLTGLATVGFAHAQPSGSIAANITQDRINGSGFGPDVSVTIQRGSEQQTWTNGVSGPWDYNSDNDNFGLYLQGTWDVRAGDTVTVIGNGLTDQMTIADLRVTAWDFGANTISGTVSPYDNSYPIFLSVGHYGQENPSTLTVQRVSGESGWTGDMDDVDTNASPPIDLRVNDSVDACQPDAAQNESCITSVLAGPRFTFGVETQEVVGLDWPDSVPVTLTIDRPSTVADPDYTHTMTPPTTEPYSGYLQTGNQGRVYFDLTTGFPAQPGDVITMTNGTTAKTLTVPTLTTNLPNLTSGVLSGSASAVPTGGFLTAASGYFSWGGGSRQDVDHPTSGSWTADFGSGGIDPTQNGNPVAYLTYPDGDVAESIAPWPTLYVDPVADRIWGVDFGPGTTTVTVQRKRTVLYSATVPTTNVLTKGSWNIDMWTAPVGTLQRPAVARVDLTTTVDIRPGDVVTVTDGVSTRSVTVATLTFDRISPDPINTITGQATQTVSIHLGDGEGGYWGYQATPVRGEWSSWFDKTQFPNPINGLRPGDKLQVMVRTPSGDGTVVRATVVATTAMPDDITPIVRGLGLSSRTERNLLASLTAAQRAYDAGRIDAGARAMGDFKTKVLALTPATIPQHVSDVLVADANVVISAHS